MSTSKTALILGATGLVGGHLLQLLLEDDSYGKVKIFVRRAVGIEHPKLEVHIVDFDQPETWKSEVKGDVLFSTMGTTIRNAGSQVAQYRVDYTYQYRAAEAAASQGVPSYVLVSSAGAAVDSMFFYSRMKGELDRDVQKLPLTRIRIIKPSVLDGDRKENRLAESISISLGKVMGFLLPPLKKYRPIHAKSVAKAMIHAVNDQPDKPFVEYQWQEVFSLAGD